jgi:hypothetical protein
MESEWLRIGTGGLLDETKRVDPLHEHSLGRCMRLDLDFLGILTRDVACSWLVSFLSPSYIC